MAQTKVCSPLTLASPLARSLILIAFATMIMIIKATKNKGKGRTICHAMCPNCSEEEEEINVFIMLNVYFRLVQLAQKKKRTKRSICLDPSETSHLSR